MSTGVPSICALLCRCRASASNVQASSVCSLLMGKKRINGLTCAPAGFTTIEPRARLRVTKAPPAPLMDGIDVSMFELGRVYTVGASLANYLILAGYATLEILGSHSAHDKPPRRRRRRR